MTESLYFPILFTYFIHFPPSLRPGKAIQSLFFVSMSLFHLFVYVVFQFPHISEIRWYLSFSAWLIPLSIILSRSTCVVRNDKISFLSYGWAIFYFVCVCVYTTSSLSMSLLMDILRLLPYLIYNSAAMNKGKHIPVWISIFVFLG